MRLVQIGITCLLVVAVSPSGAQETGGTTTSPFKIERLADGIVFRGYVTLDSGPYKETLLATGACAITKGKFISTPRVEDAIYSAGESTRHVFGSDAGPNEGASFVGKLVGQGDKVPGDSHCLIQRRVETGCAFGKCLTARQFDVYLMSYDRTARPLGSGTDVCGGSVLRGAGECLPIVSGGGSAVAGMALCIETQADLKGGGKQPASMAIAYGIVPKAVAAQAESASSRQDASCASRGLSGVSGLQGAPVAAPAGTSSGSSTASAETGGAAPASRRSIWGIRLPRLPRQPKTSVTDEFRD